MIHNIYVISERGEPIVSIKLGSIEAPEVLVSGFLSAIQTFSKQLVGSEVQEVTTGSLHMLMRRVDEVLVAVAVDVADRDARRRLDNIASIIHNHLGKTEKEALKQLLTEAATKDATVLDRGKLWVERGM
jgi:hypothetical protein